MSILGAFVVLAFAVTALLAISALAEKRGGLLEGARQARRLSARARRRPKGLRVRTKWIADKERKRSALQIAVEGPRLARDLCIYNETLPAKLDPEVEDVSTGDIHFDELVIVQGPEALVRATFGAECRALVVRALGETNRLTVVDGSLVLRASAPFEMLLNPERLRRAALALARALCVDDADVPSRLVENALHDSSSRVRMRCLETLSKLAGAELQARKVRLAQLDDSAPEVRLRAALGLGPEALEELLALAARERDAQTLARLLRHLSAFAGERLWPVLDAAFGSQDESLDRAIAEAARVTGYAEMARRFTAYVDSALGLLDAKRLTSIARTLAVFRAPASEPTLIRLLAHEAREVQIAAAEGLGEFGGVAAVEPLVIVSERLPAWGDAKAALLKATARIQSRLGNVEVGAVSLAQQDATQGAVSLADGDDDGALSLVESRRGTS